MSEGNLSKVDNIILVLSGKGGVGKSSVSVQIAVTLALAGHKVGLLDVDLCGPSIPRMTNTVDSKITQGAMGWKPVILQDGENSVIKIMSIGFLLPKQDDAIIWRGPKKSSMINQFLFNTEWGALDYLIIDTPPGTSDEHISLVENLSTFNPKAILVTTPQLVALADVSRLIGFCQTVNLFIIGLIENMSGYLCPHCSECTNVFSSEGGCRLAEKYKLDFLGKIPISSVFTKLVESNDTHLLRDYACKAPELYNLFKQTILKDILK